MAIDYHVLIRRFGFMQMLQELFCVSIVSNCFGPLKQSKSLILQVVSPVLPILFPCFQYIYIIRGV